MCIQLAKYVLDKLQCEASECLMIGDNLNIDVIGAKNAVALREMNFLIKTRKVCKYYKCRVEGKITKAHDKINAFIVKDEKTNKSKIEKDGKKDRRI